MGFIDEKFPNGYTGFTHRHSRQGALLGNGVVVWFGSGRILWGFGFGRGSCSSIILRSINGYSGLGSQVFVNIAC